MWQLLLRGQLVKEHSSKCACVIEAYEKDWVMVGPSIRDFDGDPDLVGRFLMDGVEIKEIVDDNSDNRRNDTRIS